MADTQGNTKSIGSQNTFTDPLRIGEGKQGTLTITGTFSATVTLQVRLLGGTTWTDIDTVTTTGRWQWPGGNDDWRAGVKTGDYSSGTAVVNIQGGA